MFMHDYVILNIAIAVTYLVVRAMLVFPNISYAHKLSFSRVAFIMSIGLFFIMPLLHFSSHSHFQLGPMIRTVSDGLVLPHTIMSQEIMHVGVSHALFPLNTLALLFIALGVAVYLGKYVKNIIYLNNIIKTSFCQHRMHNIHILFSQNIAMPFCWSFLNKHYIAMPNSYLERYDDLKLALRHELQHIRQGDTYWIHGLNIMKALCFVNPFIYLWIKWFDLLQEFSCDEAIVLRQKTSPAAYAQCLLNAVSEVMPQCALGIRGLSKSILYRRVTMVFNFKDSKAKVVTLIGLYVGTALIASTTAYAINGQSSTTPLTIQQVEKIIQQSHFDKSFQISATPEVVAELNNIRSSDHAQEYMSDSLERMKTYQHYIQTQLTQNNLPHELLAIPLVESGYQPLDQSKNPVQAAGIWQFIPQTAKNFGLIINSHRDDRLDTKLSTKAAMSYLTDLHNQFNNWGLAVISYEYGEDNISMYMKAAHSQDIWTIARSSYAPKTMTQFIATFDASLIIMKNPSLLSKS
ncbi:MAG TPA: M56 and MltD domain-containing protein [Gammaproteobacteria bacterium]|nr:M56 and MltD domain-containing protein [Gammaproteobacteria bacterium]